MMGSRPSDFSSLRRSQPPPRKPGSSRPPGSPPPSRRAAAPEQGASLLMNVEQLLREPPRESSAPFSEAPRSLSNEALLASLRPPAHPGSSELSRQARELRRSMEPHLVEGLSWFAERSAWQRALLSTGLGALVGVGIVVTLARLFVPDLTTPSLPAAPSLAAASAASGLAALAAPPAESTPVEAQRTALPAAEPGEPLAAAQPSDVTAAPPAAATAVSDEPLPEAKPRKGKAARAKHAARRNKAAKQRARKAASTLPANWSELYARDR